MKLILVTILTFSCVFAYENSEEFINEINRKQNLWKAGHNFHKDMPLSKIRNTFGTKLLQRKKLENVPVMIHEESEDIPESFDARTQWPKCKTIGVVGDQGACTSCWAISVAGLISDRICIQSDGKLQPVISPQYLVSCEPRSFGCGGGFPIYSLEFWTNMGVVTGGYYGSKIGCQPYTFPPCDHHVNVSKPLCPAEIPETPDCVKTCENSINYEKDLFYGESYYSVGRNETQIQLEILKNGPVVAVIALYEDIIYYKSGIYARTVKVPFGLHSVRIIGWGVENGVKYWRLVNSWNEDWGENGMMRILRGVEECEIEAMVAAGQPRLK